MEPASWDLALQREIYKRVVRFLLEEAVTALLDPLGGRSPLAGAGARGHGQRGS